MSNLDKFISIKEVADICGFKATFIYARIRQGEFPAPIKFGAASRWSQNAIQKWIAEKVREAA